MGQVSHRSVVREEGPAIVMDVVVAWELMCRFPFSIHGGSTSTRTQRCTSTERLPQLRNYSIVCTRVAPASQSLGQSDLPPNSLETVGLYTGSVLSLSIQKCDRQTSVVCPKRNSKREKTPTRTGKCEPCRHALLSACPLPRRNNSGLAETGSIQDFYVPLLR